MLLILSFIWLVSIAILIGRALRQRGVFRDICASNSASCDAPKVTVIVPARNEQQNVRNCLEGLLSQNYPAAALKIVTVDDNSTDRTLSIMEEIAAESRRVEVLRASPLAPGWCGKSHACWIAAASLADESEWLCFTDADITASPDLIRSAVMLAEEENIDFLSLTPRQILVSFSERLVLPCGLYFLAFSQNLAEVNSPKCPNATATGQFILLRGPVYKVLGGHEAVRREICEDVALARLARKKGFKAALYGGGKLYSTRMYTGWSTLWPGISKNLAEMLGGPAKALIISALGLALAWFAPVLPVAAAFRCGASESSACLALAMALPASAAAFALHISGAAFFGIPLWYGLIFPLGYTAGVALAIDSVRRRWTGQIRWKGRVYS